jgi:hypothetical protein
LVIDQAPARLASSTFLAGALLIAALYIASLFIVLTTRPGGGTCLLQEDRDES